MSVPFTRADADRLLETGFDFPLGKLLRSGLALLRGGGTTVLGLVILRLLLAATLPFAPREWVYGSLVVGIPLEVSLYILLFSVARNEPLRLGASLVRWNLMWGTLVIQILASVFFLGGLLLLVLPGVYLFVAMILGIPLFLSGVEPRPSLALGLSRRLVRREWRKVLPFGLLMLIWEMGSLFLTPDAARSLTVENLLVFVPLSLGEELVSLLFSAVLAAAVIELGLQSQKSRTPPAGL